MAKPERSERSRSALPLRQLGRFCYLINSDMVFGTDSQSPAAHDGMTSAARSAAAPMVKNSHPAMSLDPSDRANQPFVVMPTPASANAAATKRTEATRCDGVAAR